MKAVSDYKFGCKIILHRNSYIASDGELKHYWTGFRFETYMKWEWYFRFRQALLQVQYPKRYVEMERFKYEWIPPREEQIKRLTNRLQSAKAKHTEWSRKIERAKKNWNQLFPIEDYSPYQKAMAKVQEKLNLINELQNQIADL